MFFLFLKDCFALTSLNDVLSCSVSISAYVSSVDTYGERSSRSMNGSAFSLDFLTPETYKNRRYFVTAYHVVANASSVKVILQDVQERVDDEADLTKYQFDLIQNLFYQVVLKTEHYKFRGIQTRYLTELKIKKSIYRAVMSFCLLINW